MKKILSGLLAGAIMLIISLATGKCFQFLFPSIRLEYENPQLFRPWTDPLMSIYFLEPFVTGVILAWLWNIVKGNIKGNTLTEKGINFGFIYWVITIPGMLMSYSSFPLSPQLVFSWSATILAQAICAGLLFSKMLK